MKFRKLTTLLFMVVLCLSFSAFANEDDEACMTCHDDEDLTGLDIFEEEISMYATTNMVNATVHEGMSCIECHTDLDGFDDYPHEDELEKVDCTMCHDEIGEIFNESAHSNGSTNPYAPSCASCHGTHNILPSDDPESISSPQKLPYTCSECHNKKLQIADPDIITVNQFDRYMKGIHAEGMSRGIESSATCSDCHGIHDLKRASDRDSKVHKMNIPKTCAKCHNDIFIKYNRGIHGKALAVGILDAPNCADCHGEHEILSPNNPDSPVNASHLSDYVCGKCHNDERMMEKYGLSNERFTSYQDTYHGLAVSGGSIKAANCASCHKAHDILPTTNPASSIHPNNLTVTCQKCHVDANDAFASSYTHETAIAEYNEINRFVEYIYIIMIVVVIGGMILHNLIILGRHIADKKKAQKNMKMVQRFRGPMVFQHFLVTITFITLAATGFALKYPNEWWVSVLKWIGIDEGSRSTIHRISAVVMLYASVHHVFYLMFSKRGRFHFKQLLPVKEDITQPIENMKYHLGLSDKRPHFAYYDYTEKAEYWALVWGTMIMAFTGFVLWFPTFFTAWLPGWIIKVSETIHFYEAWLATLAIVFFHFFFVMFLPDRYPLSLTMTDGMMPLDEVKHHHPKWYEELKKEEEEEAEKNKDEKSQPEEKRLTD